MDTIRFYRLIKSAQACGGLPFILKNSHIQVAPRRCRQFVIWQTLCATLIFYAIFLVARTLIFANRLKYESSISTSESFFNLNICLAFAVCASVCLVMHLLTAMKLYQFPMMVNAFISHANWFLSKRINLVNFANNLANIKFGCVIFSSFSET